MPKKNFTDQTAELVIKDFQLDTQQESFSEQELFDLLANQIAYMIQYRSDFLLSLMYRLDVPEAQVSHALSPTNPEPANLTLARIVLSDSAGTLLEQIDKRPTGGTRMATYPTPAALATARRRRSRGRRRTARRERRTHRCR